jgi:hypothetical protein
VLLVQNIRRSYRKSKGTASASEFAVSLCVLLLIFTFPIIDILAVVGGAAIGLLGSRQLAYEAAVQRRYSDSLSCMETSALNYAQTGFANFLHLQPVGGYRGCGGDLFIDSSNYVSGSNTRYGPNTPVPPPIDTSANIYECTVTYTCQVGPLVDLGSVPWIGTVPGLGKPCVLSMTSSRAAEYPRGLEFPSSNIASAGGGSSVPFNFNSTVPFNSGTDASGWNNPQIYTMIKNAGETVADDEVVNVPANANATSPTTPQWTNTGLIVGSAQKIWIDLRSDGVWSDGSTGQFNANGTGRTAVTGPMVGQPTALLLGKIGSNAPFVCGEVKLNYTVTGQSGPLYLMMNDNTNSTGYMDNTGNQMVRVIIAQ